MKKVFLSLEIILAAVLLISVSTTAEEITLTTYYPAPYGEYKNLRIHPDPAFDPTAPCSDAGEMACAGSGQTYVCDGANWQPLGGGIPRGVIVMWSGTLAKIPSGWALCNGTNGTPDLRDKFVYGVSAGQNPGATGGTVSHSQSTSAELLAAVDGYVYIPGVGYHPNKTTWSMWYGRGLQVSGTVVDLPGNRDISVLYWGGTSEVEHLPPYFKLAYIMKL